MADWEIKNNEGDVVGRIAKDRGYSPSLGPEDRGEGLWVLFIGNPFLAAVGGLLLGVLAAIVTIPGRTVVAAIQKALGASAEARAVILQADPASVGVFAGKLSFALLIILSTMKWFTKAENLRTFGLLILGIFVLIAGILAWQVISRYAGT